MDQDIVTFARREYNLFLGERTAEDIKIAIGSAYPGEWDAQRVALRGRDLLTGLPRCVEVGADQIREAIEPSVQQIVDTVKDTIEETPPELVADIMDQGIVLAGGGALLAGPRPARRRGDPDAGPHRRRPADLRGARHRRRAPGPRPDGARARVRDVLAPAALSGPAGPTPTEPTDMTAMLRHPGRPSPRVVFVVLLAASRSC